jgi:hypothetical protein
VLTGKVRLLILRLPMSCVLRPNNFAESATIIDSFVTTKSSFFAPLLKDNTVVLEELARRNF